MSKTAPETPDGSPSWFVTYKRPFAPPTYVSLIVTPPEGCLVTVTGLVEGYGWPEAPEIGTYIGPCTQAEAEEIHALTYPALAAASASQGMGVPPGTGMLAFGIGIRGADSVDSLGAFPLSETLPTDIQKLDQAAMSLARQLLQHKTITLRGSARCAKPVVAPKAELEFSLRLVNSGIRPLRLRNPAGVSTDESTGLTLLLKDSEDELEAVALKSQEVKAVAKGPPAELVTLQPNEELALAIKVRRVFLSKGSYRASFNFISDAEHVPETEAVGGLLHLEAGSFEVRRPR